MKRKRFNKTRTARVHKDLTDLIEEITKNSKKPITKVKASKRIAKELRGFNFKI